MSILINKDTRVIVQGITGRIGSIQTKWMLDYNTNVVGGVTPGKGGATVEGLPVFDTVNEAVKETGANILATACENCHTQLDNLNEHYKMKVDVRFLSSMVADALVPA